LTVDGIVKLGNLFINISALLPPATKSMAAPKPRIRVRRAVPADADTLVDIFEAAFAPDVMQGLMHPGGFTADARAKFGATFFPNDKKGETIVMVAERLPDDGPDDGPGEMVALSKWILHREPRTEDEWNVETPETVETLGEGSNATIHNEFIGGLERKRREQAKGDPALSKYPLLP
jgi:hypothetical protein